MLSILLDGNAQSFAAFLLLPYFTFFSLILSLIATINFELFTFFVSFFNCSFFSKI